MWLYWGTVIAVSISALFVMFGPQALVTLIQVFLILITVTLAIGALFLFGESLPGPDSPSRAYPADWGWSRREGNWRLGLAALALMVLAIGLGWLVFWAWAPQV